MAGWAGFSEDELRRLKGQPEFPRSADHPRRQPSAVLSRQQMQRKKALQLQSERLAKEDGSLLASKEMRLSKPPLTPSPALLAEPTYITKETHGDQHQSPVAESQRNAMSKDIRPEQDEEVVEKEMELREKPRLDQLQMEQRLIEEKNKRKKALLAKAIAERSKKTQAETVKLKRIQKQLQALDDLVSSDIEILRNRIEQACVQFSQAKKRFDKAESEYIISKLDLHKKTEIKEQLTEHLCTIIQENESRKAKRLEELMKQLDVETDDEKLELEIEVEQILEQQETRKQSVEPQVEQERKLVRMEDIDPQTSRMEDIDAHNAPVHTSLLVKCDNEVEIAVGSNTASD